MQYIAVFYCNKNIFWQKTYFCRQKLFLPARFFHGKFRFFPPSGKNLPTLIGNNRRTVPLLTPYSQPPFHSNRSIICTKRSMSPFTKLLWPLVLNITSVQSRAAGYKSFRFKNRLERYVDASRENK